VQLGVERRRVHVDLGDRLRRRHVRVVMRQPDVHVHRAVGAGRVHVLGGAVDIGRERPARRVGRRVLRGRRRGARHQVQQRLVIAVRAQRHGLHRLRRDLALRSRTIGLELRGIGRDFDRFGDLPDLQREVDAGDVACRYVEVLLRDRAKSGGRDAHIVTSGHDVRDIEVALRIGLGFARLSRLFVGDGDCRFGHGGARRIRKRSDDRPVEHLCLGARRQSEEENDRRGSYA
jgi:hypothetical protein